MAERGLEEIAGSTQLRAREIEGKGVLQAEAITSYSRERLYRVGSVVSVRLVYIRQDLALALRLVIENGWAG